MDVSQLNTALFSLLVLYILWFLTRKLYSNGKKNLPPSPPKLPIIGNLHQLGHLPHRSLWKLSRKYGPLMLLHLGNKPTLVVSSAEVAKEIFKNHDISFAGKPVLSVPKRIFCDLKDVINLPYGDQWRKLRSIFVNQLLNSKRVKSFNSIMDEETYLLMERIKKLSLLEVPVNLTEMFASLTNDTICRSAFGKKYSETKHGRRFLEKMSETVGLLFNFTIGEFVPWLAWINWLNGFDAKVDRVAHEKDGILDAVIQEHFDAVGEAANDGSRETFVNILVGIYKGDTPGISIDKESVRAVILDVFGAGTETSATTLGWVMTELIRNPDVMKKLQVEVREIMNGKQHITDNDLEKMHYLKAVIKENFRCHPPVAIYLHESREDVNLMGYDIPSGTMVLFNAWGLGRDPAWWDEPEKFMPERFINSSTDFKGFNYQFIPFGAGRRICPGISFATASIERVLVNLMHKFDWALPNGAKGEDLDVIEQPGLTIGRKNPLIVVATKCYF
ncbi:hypothetical protein RD792_014905 [Penstemon davidsonii]|uniref:Cytochrome P450 n=1 Tax=Penstemon davidsonii TaxID=160366 RepID=A0ABR0CQN8_9LAMI|nr:hypothetical protein RD792_014905 [Penstemon davidsonii]